MRDLETIETELMEISAIADDPLVSLAADDPSARAFAKLKHWMDEPAQT